MGRNREGRVGRSALSPPPPIFLIWKNPIARSPTMRSDLTDITLVVDRSGSM